MSEKRPIRVPTIADDPIAGRLLAAFPFTCRFIQPPLNIFTDNIIIENETLIYQGSKTSFRADKTYDLKNMARILVVETKLTPWDKAHKIKAWAG